MRSMVALVLPFVFTGCAPAQMLVDSSCASFQIIRASTRDTDETKRQIVGHNRAYEAICPARERV
jgi:hypothetical protein